MYTVIFSKQAEKDKALLKRQGLDLKAKELLNIISENPFQNPPPFEELVGNLSGLYSRRINYQHRLVYDVIESENVVHVLRMWTRYES